MKSPDVQAVVVAVGTAVPEHQVLQADVRAFAKRFFAQDFPELDRLLNAFGNTGIDRRHLACPLEWYDTPHSFPEKNEIYRKVALDLAEEASRIALDRSGLRPSEVRAVLFVSSTGVATPSLDSHLIQRLDLPRDVMRTPVWGLGCAGGGAGIARGSVMCKALGGPVLVVASEVCSTTFVHEDRSKSNLIATALFGDGAAAAVLVPASPGGPAPKGLGVLAGLSLLIDDSEDVMGWAVRDTGLQVRFARSIPALVRDLSPTLLDQARSITGGEAPTHAVLHPGGAKVLEAYEQSLGAGTTGLHLARDVLREFGNMSSPTVLFVLERFMEQTAVTDTTGVLLGLGPGFCAEGVVFRW